MGLGLRGRGAWLHKCAHGSLWFEDAFPSSVPPYFSCYAVRSRGERREERGERREETEKREREPKPSRKTDIAMLNPKRHKFLQDAQNP